MKFVLLASVFISQVFGNLEATSLTSSTWSKATAIHQFIGNLPTDFNSLSDMEDAKLSVPDLIEKYGYPVEIHEITTEDNYTLEAHRIPFGKKCGESREAKRVIWLQHGLFGDSSNWVITGVDKGLAYLLADACYDVWIGNARGNTYSKRHNFLDPIQDKEDFWAFSWHEMGIYDLPAVIDYALNNTGAEDLYYVGHSMGTTMFWVCMSERPEYNSKIKLMSALAPVAYMTNIQSPIRALAPLANRIELLLQTIGLYEFLPSSAFIAELGAKLCDPLNPYHPICSNVLFVFCGFNMDQMDVDLLPVIVGHSPAGSSTRSVVHYAQGVNNTLFTQYDFGPEGNVMEYGQESPPGYDLTKITAPVALYWGDNDYLANLTDVQRLAGELANVKLNYRVKHDEFNHLDFVFAIDVDTLINEPLMYFMDMGLEATTRAPAPTTRPTEGGSSSSNRLEINLIKSACLLILVELYLALA